MHSEYFVVAICMNAGLGSCFFKGGKKKRWKLELVVEREKLRKLLFSFAFYDNQRSSLALSLRMYQRVKILENSIVKDLPSHSLRLFIVTFIITSTMHFVSFPLFSLLCILIILYKLSLNIVNINCME